MGHGERSGTLSLLDIPKRHPVHAFDLVWQSIVDLGDPPQWRSYGPEMSVSSLPWMMVLKRVEENRWKYVICGERAKEMLGFNYQGKFFGEHLPPQAVRERQQEFDSIERDGKPRIAEIRLPDPGREFIAVYRAVYPFHSGERISRFVVVLAPKEVRV